MRLSFDKQKEYMENLYKFEIAMENHLSTINNTTSDGVIINIENALASIKTCIYNLNKCRIV